MYYDFIYDVPQWYPVVFPAPKPAPKPPLHIYDPAFKYTNSANTDIRLTFARVRARMK